MQSIAIASRGYMVSNLDQAKPDLLLEPLIEIKLLDFAKVEEAVEFGRKLGEEAAEKAKEWLQ